MRESVQEGRLTVCHVEGREQLADLATKLQPRLRLQQLLRMWGFVGTYLNETMKILKLKAVMLVMVLSSLICPSRAQPTNEKEPLKRMEWDEIVLLLLVVCMMTIGIWELIKVVCRRVAKYMKGLRKAKKLQDVGAIAAEAARREIRIHEERRLDAGRSRHVRDEESSSSHLVETPEPRRGVIEPLSSPTLKSESSRVERSTSPVVSRRILTARQSSSTTSSRINLRAEDAVERARVVRDMLALLTLEDLKTGLRFEGLPVTGVKADLIARLSHMLSPMGDDREASLPTMRQMKYVLWLFRQKNLSGRVRLHWETVNDRARISQWIETWRTA